MNQLASRETQPSKLQPVKPVPIYSADVYAHIKRPGLYAIHIKVPGTDATRPNAALYRRVYSYAVRSPRDVKLRELTKYIRWQTGKKQAPSKHRTTSRSWTSHINAPLAWIKDLVHTEFTFHLLCKTRDESISEMSQSLKQRVCI